MDLREAVEEYHRAADEFSRGNPEPVKALLSDRDDVTLANPFGPAVRGRQHQVFLPICRDFSELAGLEPATSWVRSKTLGALNVAVLQGFGAWRADQRAENHLQFAGLLWSSGTRRGPGGKNLGRLSRLEKSAG
jgi:hypothetical protein